MFVYNLSIVASSVTDAIPTLNTPNDKRSLHSINVTSMVQPYSDANICEVTAFAIGQRTKRGKVHQSIFLPVTVTYVHTHK